MDKFFFNNVLTEVVKYDSKTELYLNGVRYNVNEDYTIIDGTSIDWINPIPLETTDVLTFVYH